MYSSSVISKEDLSRIVNTIAPCRTEADDRHEIDERLRKISQSKIKQWPNSTENANKSKLEAAKREFLRQENMKRQIDEEERKYKALQDNMTNERAKKLYFNSQDLVKSFKSKMLFCDILKERNVQMSQSKVIKERWDEYDQYWNEIEKQKMIAYDKEEERKYLENKEKQAQNMAFIHKQFQEAKVKRIQDMQEQYVEGQITKIQAQNELKEELAKKERDKQARIKLNEQFRLDNIEIERLKAEAKKKEEEEDAKIEEHARKKEALENLRKQKEKEKFEEKQKRRQHLIDAQTEHLRKIKEENEMKLNKDVQAKELADEMNEKLKKEKYEKMQNEIKEDRKLYLQRIKEQKEQEKKESLNQVEQWRKEMKEAEERERNEYLKKRAKAKELQLYRSQQEKDKRQKALEEYMNLQEESLKNHLMLSKEREEFLQFAEEQIRLYKQQGKDILPLLLELKLYKKQGLL